MKKREKKKSALIKQANGQSVPDTQATQGQKKKKRPRQKAWGQIVFVGLLVFGVPLGYIGYRKGTELFRYVGAASSSETSYTFPEYTYDFDLEHEKMRENMKKYNYSHDLNSIDRRENLTLQEFIDVYDAKWPVLLTDCLPKWPAFKKWTVDFFKKNYGDHVGSMRAYGGTSDHYLGLPLGTFLEHLDQGYPNSWTYFNDELFIPKRPELGKDILVCDILQEDYFQMFQPEIRPWWAFILWGTRFSRSHLHMDPYNWTGTNAVISGLKHWKLYPPGQDHLFYMMHGRRSNFPLDCFKYNSPVDAFDSKSMDKYPDSKKAQVLEFYQYPGEFLVIPTGWLHQAFNEQPTLAVSGQMMNGRNYRVVLEEIFKANTLPRDGYPPHLDKKSVTEQVAAVLSKVTEKTLQKGRESSDFMLKQMQAIQAKVPVKKEL